LRKTSLRLKCGIVVDINVSEERAVSIFRVEEWWTVISFLENPATFIFKVEKLERGTRISEEPAVSIFRVEEW
jgi:Na+-transporting NADH:ubiquinone oxidoreductase subunit NqrF